MPDETVDNKWNPYDDLLTDADMLEELINSNSEDEEKLLRNYTRCTSRSQFLGCISLL